MNLIHFNIVSRKNTRKKKNIAISYTPLLYFIAIQPIYIFYTWKCLRGGKRKQPKLKGGKRGAKGGQMLNSTFQLKLQNIPD